MTYEKQTWINGDVITAEKMNHMEDGIANAGGGDTDAFVINVSLGSDWVLVSDKSYGEIGTAYEEGKQLEVVFNNVTYSFVGGDESSGEMEYRFASGLVGPGFFPETTASTTAWAACIIISTDAVQQYAKNVTLTFS